MFVVDGWIDGWMCVPLLRPEWVRSTSCSLVRAGDKKEMSSCGGHLYKGRELLIVCRRRLTLFTFVWRRRKNASLSRTMSMVVRISPSVFSFPHTKVKGASTFCFLKREIKFVNYGGIEAKNKH